MHAKNTRNLTGIALIGVMLFVFLFQFVVAPSASAAPSPADFVHAQGGQLVVGAAGTPIRLTGVNFPAYGWGDAGEDVSLVYNAKDFRQEDYFRVASMGMNVIRLDIWYALFEDDSAPYVYKQAGWDWLDQQVAYAKAAGLYINLCMMRPQGEYQGPDYTGSFWGTNAQYRDRLKALWVAIATRYKDETQISSFDLLNEPNTNDNNAKWVSYSQELVNAIRTVDTNHLIDIEQDVVAAIPFLVTDPSNNVMYDSHFYEPYYYTKQFVTRGFQGQYGDPLTPIMPWDGQFTFGTPLTLAQVPSGTTGWVLYESPLFLAEDPTVSAQPVFIPSGSGKIYFDDFFITEYAPDGSSQVLMNVDLENVATGYSSDNPYYIYKSNLTTLSGSGTSTVQTTTAHSGAVSFTFSAKFTSARLNFPVRRGYSYKISGWMKGETVAGTAGGITLRWADWVYGDYEPFTKETMEQHLLDPSGSYGFQFYLDNNVPMNVGEWGLSPFSFTPSRGGLDYARDNLALFAKYNINSTYWVYSRFGNYSIYRNTGPGYYDWPSPANANQPLVDLFTEILTGGSPVTPTNTPNSPTVTNTPSSPTATNTPSAAPIVIFSDGYETGLNWTISGDTTWYTGSPKNGTHSARIMKVGTIEKTISTVGYDSISVSFYMGASSLDSSDENVEALWYDGSAWVVLKHIISTEDDGQLYPYEYQLPASANNNPNLALRLKITANNVADYGYVDDVVVKGYASGGTPAPTATPIPSTATNTPTNTPVPPTATYTPTNTPIPPTATNTPTNTPVPPTATNTPTNTPVPPTATYTSTNTPIPPTATNTPTPTATSGSTSQRIFLDDFETAFSGWNPSGTITWYTGSPRNGTHSLKVASSGAWMSRTISTVGYHDIVVRVYMGAESFEASETFKLFWWNGSSWVSLKSITNGAPEEDGQLHYLEFTLPSGANNTATFKLAFNLQTSDTTDYGYIDDVEVWGTP